MSIRHLLICLAVLGTPVTAQLADGTWLGWSLSSPGSCSICAYLPNGTLINGVGVGGFGIPHVVKHKQGLVYGVDTLASTLQIYGAGVVLGTIPLNSIIDAAVLPSGQITVLAGNIFFGTTVTQYDLSGARLWTANLPQAVHYVIRTDPQGRSWVADTMGNVTVIDSLGVSLGTFAWTLAGSSFIRVFEMDRAGRGWLLRDSAGGTSVLQRLEVPSGLVMQVNTPLAIAMDIDVEGRVRVLRDTPTGEVVESYDADSGALVGSISLSQSSAHSSMIVDSAGNLWLEIDQNGQGYDVFDSTGTRTATISSALTVRLDLGDPSGVHMINCDPLGDADGDGISNTQEVELGSDPGSAASVPPTLSVASAPTVGVGFSVLLQSPAEPGLAYLCGLSAGQSGIPVGGNSVRSVPLTADPLLAWWLSPQNSVATGVTGALDAMGQAMVTASITPSLGNVPVNLAFVTLSNGMATVESISLPLELILP